MNLEELQPEQLAVWEDGTAGGRPLSERTTMLPCCQW